MASLISNHFQGKRGNIEVVVYGKKSIFAKNQILKNSQDPLARSIAAQELLELMKVVVIPVPMAAVVNETSNANIASGSTITGVSVDTS